MESEKQHRILWEGGAWLLLARDSPTPRSFRKHALSLTFFASKLAPTDGIPTF
jgi:hypothetical protein